MTKTLRIIKFIAVMMSGCFFISSCENDIREVQSFTRKRTGIEEGKQIESYLSQDGKLKAKLMAPSMLRYQADTPRVEFPKTLKVDFYDDNLQVESKMFARYGEYKEHENKVFLRDSVIVFNRMGDTLISKELYWDQNKSTFYTDKNVIIKKPDQKIYGKGLVADQSFKWFTIHKPHNSFINVADSSFLAQ